MDTNKVTAHNNLLAFAPEIAAEWHPTLNGELRADQVIKGSTKKVWWLCKHGHEWQTTVNYRALYKRRCPYCIGRKVSKENNLAVVDPELAAQWHPTKNLPLTPATISASHSKKVWWLCQFGHEWQAKPTNRRKYGNDCPFCLGRKATAVYNLKTARPDVAAHWHPTKNGDLRPEDVLPRSKKVVYWLCQKGHEAHTMVTYRTKSGCIACNRLKGKTKPYHKASYEHYPNLVKEWHPTKNNPVTIADVCMAADVKVWWLCEEGHEWCAPPRTRTEGKNCPYCSGRLPSPDYNFAALYPEKVKLWHPTKNGTLKPEMFTPGSGKVIWWQCEKGHEWRDKIAMTSKKTGCGACERMKKSEAEKNKG